MRGKATWFRLALGDNEDHPRLCGEKTETTLSAQTALGSPPPMRGKGHLQLMNPQPAGITPAYAGKSRQHKG